MSAKLPKNCPPFKKLDDISLFSLFVTHWMTPFKTHMMLNIYGCNTLNFVCKLKKRKIVKHGIILVSCLGDQCAFNNGTILLVSSVYRCGCNVLSADV